MIYWNNKNIFFQENSKDFIQNNFELMISIYLFKKYFLQVIDSISFVFDF